MSALVRTEVEGIGGWKIIVLAKDCPQRPISAVRASSNFPKTSRLVEIGVLALALVFGKLPVILFVACPPVDLLRVETVSTRGR